LLRSLHSIVAFAEIRASRNFTADVRPGNPTFVDNAKPERRLKARCQQNSELVYPEGGCYEIQNAKCEKPGDFADFQKVL
jgi:hypothetical protein